MTCSNCGNAVKLKNEFCPNCGHRVVHTLDDIISTSQDDAARRHGEALTGHLRAAIVSLLILFSAVIGCIYLYDKKITFDGSGLPWIQANAPIATGAPAETLEKTYTDPRPLPPLPAPVTRALGHRVNPVRSVLRAANGGGGREFESAIRNGLFFLDKAQEKDGGWPVALIPANVPQDATADFKWGRTGVSSLALLAFLGDGHTWIKEDTGARSPHAENVRRGVRFLLSVQDSATGQIGGGEGHFMYNHAMATLALAEAATLSGDAELKEHARKAADYLIKTQTARGGWDYFGHAQSEIDDISVSAWAVQALAAAHETGIQIPVETLAKALGFYTALTKGERGVYNFQQDDGQYVPARSGMVLMIRQLLGDSPANQDIKLLASKLVASIPKVKTEWGKGWSPKSKDALERAKFDPYMMFFCTYGMFFAGGRDWEEWNQKASKALFDMQDNDGAWRANDGYSKQGGTCYSTALCVLALQAHHRIVHSVATRTVGSGKDE